MYKLLDLSQQNEWRACIEKLPIDQQDVYYTPEYYELYQNYGDGKAQCFIFEKDGEIALYPFLINSINALGYELDKEYFDIEGAYGYNGVVSTSSEKTFLNSFYNSFNHYCNTKGIIAEFTRFHPLLENQELSKSHLDIIFDRKTIYLNIKEKTQEEIFKNFQRSTKKQIKRAKYRHKIEIRIEKGNNENLEIFYPLYLENMKRIEASSYFFFEKSFFQGIFQKLQHFLFTAYYKGEAIASIIVLCSDTKMHGHLGGAKKDYLDLSAVSLLYNEIIAFGIDNNYELIHFGGGRSGDNEDSLYKFKQNFSALETDFYIGKKVYLPEIYKKTCHYWENTFPEKKEKYKNILLKYRY